MNRVLVLAVASLGLACDGSPSADPCERPPIESALVETTPRRMLARAADDYFMYYGKLTDHAIEVARAHDIVVIDPNDNVTRAQVEAIQGDGEDRVLVVCYVSIGEDLRTAHLDDAALAADPRFAGDGTGPRVDPRGPFVDNEPLSGIDPLGAPSPGGTGFASFYLDDVSVRNDPALLGDGIPDRNGNFGGAFVNIGDPAWFETLQEMTFDGPDRIAGFREVLTTTHGRGLGCDGVFLDTIDTVAPNIWTSASSANETKYEWTAPGVIAFIERLREAYPDIIVVQNRGVFFFNPALEHYRYLPRGLIDFVAFESYRLNSDPVDNPHPYYYPDNRYNFTPKLMAEASRADGFRVLSLGYAEGPADQMDERTLVGESTLGYESLLEDIHVAEELAGFRHYLTDASLLLANTFVADHATREDAEPPVWTSTYNDHSAYPEPAEEPTPRVGIQEVEPGPGSLTVRWDVALDMHRVGYALYYHTEPLDFGGCPTLATATRVVLAPEPPASYAEGVGPGVYANEATITGLVDGQAYHLVIRAFDELGNEEQNEVELTARPGATP